MLRHIDTSTSIGLVVAGVVHSGSRLAVAAGSIGDLWFTGTGLALSLLGVLNLIRVTAKMQAITLICAIANVIASLYLVMVAWMLPAPHVFVVLALAVIATLYSLVPPALAAHSGAGRW